MKSYSVVVLYYQFGEAFRNTLTNLLNQSAPPTEVVVIDNASGDGVISGLVDTFPNVHFVELTVNLGYAGGMNQGLSELQADHDWVLFLTHEVELDTECLEKLLDASESQQGHRVSVLGPSLSLARDGTIWSLGGEFTRAGGTTHRTDLDWSAPVRSATWLDGSCLLVNAEIMAARGHFAESFFLYWEDVELSTRLSSAGLVLCVLGAHAYQSTSMTPTYFTARNRILYWRMRRDPLKLLFSVFAVLAKCALRDVPQLRSDGPARLIARLQGLQHGFSGQLNLSHAKVLER